MTDYRSRLAAVQAAIDAVLEGGQSVRYEGRMITLADLGELRALERDYTAQVAAQANARAGRGRSRISYAAPY
jgi:hypothetical protein